MARIVIVGYGFVGKAIEAGFAPQNEIVIIDPKYRDNKIEYLGDFDPQFVFISVPTPMGEGGVIDDSILRNVFEDLSIHAPNAVKVLKSTVTPNIVSELFAKYDNCVYNPEFLTEANAIADFLNPPFHIFGGEPKPVSAVAGLYNFASNCRPAPELRVTAAEASFIKYGINSFLATKVVWFNQFKEMIEAHGCSYSAITNAMSYDRRIGGSHMKVPGPDGKKGFGGACFPKDTAAIWNLSLQDTPLSVLGHVIDANKAYRLQYELDDREKEQNIKYD
jgi:nucleotide sugar dehydrogenase